MIISPEVINKGLFSKKYAVYKVTTAPFKYEVKRRFSDFMWLRTMLVREYSTIYVSDPKPRFLPWPTKQPNGRSTKNTLIREQLVSSSSWIVSSKVKPLEVAFTCFLS